MGRDLVDNAEKYKQIYWSAFGYGHDDFVPSELSGERAVDIHHIDARGMGGNLESDRIENLMAVTRKEHNEYGDIQKYKSYLYFRHMQFMDSCGVEYDREFMKERIDGDYEIISPRQIGEFTEGERSFANLALSNIDYSLGPVFVKRGGYMWVSLPSRKDHVCCYPVLGDMYYDSLYDEMRSFMGMSESERLGRGQTITEIWKPIV